MQRKFLKLKTISMILATAASTQGQSLYWGGGNTDRADNAALPVNGAAVAGAWNATAKNWATTNTPGVYGVYVPGSIVDLGLVTNLTGSSGKVYITNETDVSLSSLFAVVQGAQNEMVYFTATSPRTNWPRSRAAPFA